MADDPTIIDKLAIALELDPKQFTDAQKAAVEALVKTRDESMRSFKVIERAGAGAAESFAGVKKEVLSLIAVLVGTGGIASLTAKMASGFAQVGYQAQIMGVKTQDLIAIAQASERFGGDQGAAKSSLQSLAQKMELVRTRGIGVLSPMEATYFNQIGAGASDSAIEVYEKFAAFAQRNRAKPQLVNQIGQGIGLDQGLVTLALNANVPAEIKKSYAMGLPTDAQIEQSKRLQTALANLKQQVDLDTQQLLIKFAPALLGAANSVDTLASSFKTLTGILTVGLPLLGSFFALKWAGNLAKLIGGGGAAQAAAAGGEAAAGGAAEGAVAAGALTAGGLAASAGIGLVAAAGLMALAPEDLESRRRVLLTKLGRERAELDRERKAGNVSPSLVQDLREDTATLNAMNTVIKSRQAPETPQEGPAAAPATMTPPPAPMPAYGQPSAAGGADLADRNNNPGNLMSHGQYRVFATFAEGWAAAHSQLLRDFKRGQTTVRSLIDDPNFGWAPEKAKGNSPSSTMNYMNYVAKALGIGIDQQINWKDPATVNRIESAMYDFESGRRHGATFGARPATGGSQTTINVGPIKIEAGGNAEHVARGLSGAVKHNLGRLANSGLSG